MYMHIYRGFTLVELMITIAVLSIVIMLAAPSINIFLVNSQIRTSLDAVTAGISQARAEAVKRNAPVEFRLASATDLSWSVVSIVENKTLQSYAQRSGTKAANLITLEPTKSDKIRFDGLGRVVKAGAAADEESLTRIDISSDRITGDDLRPLRVLIGASGNVRTCDPNPVLKANAPTDARVCP